MSKVKLLFVIILLLIQQSLLAFEKPQNTLFVFVGELMSLKHISKPEVIVKPLANGKSSVTVKMDHEYEATFRVLKSIYGDYKKETIKFAVFNHYGKPRFSNFKHSLMFVSQGEDGAFYHEKYQFFDVYKTESGRWATCFSPLKNDTSHPKVLKPVPIKFKEPIIYDMGLYAINKEKKEQLFPKEFFTIIDDYALCKGMGSYVNDLFESKKQGVLKARGLFN